MRLLVGLALASVLTLVSGLARAVEYPCTEAGLDAALAAGGTATFGCAVEKTIVVSATKAISVNGTSLDGGGKLVISGGDTLQPLVVNAGITASASNLVLEHGKAQFYGSNLVVSGTLTLTDSTIRNGTDGAGGAINVAGGGNLIASRVAVINNVSGPEAAIAIHGTATLTNVTVSGGVGRGIATRFGGTATILHSTIVANGESLFAVDGSISIGHSLLVAPAINTSVSVLTGSVTSLDYNIVSKNSAAFGGAGAHDQLDLTPQLAPLADNGGSTLTHAFLACSPGINAGATTGGPATDGRGQPRLQKGAIDIGAYESNELPCLFLDDASAAEGNAGTTALTFPVRLSGKSTLPVSATYAFADGTADGTDYTGTAGTLTLAAGVTTGSITAQITGDTAFEPNETVLASLAAPTNASLSDSSATGTITNDDVAPPSSLSIGSVSISEGNAGPTTATLTVTLAPASAGTVTVGWSTADGTATVADGDYEAASGTLTFAPGETTKDVQVSVTGDVTEEANESFTVHLANPTGATIGAADGTVGITNDDLSPLDAGSDSGADAGDDAGSEPPADAGPDTGTGSGEDAGGGFDAGRPGPTNDAAATGDAGNVGIGTGLDVDPGSGSSDDDCRVAVVGASTSSHDVVLVAAPLALAVAFLRRRRRRDR